MLFFYPAPDQQYNHDYCDHNEYPETHSGFKYLAYKSTALKGQNKYDEDCDIKFLNFHFIDLLINTLY
jgi:hypothetical protein